MSSLTEPMTPSELKAITDDFTKPLMAVVVLDFYNHIIHPLGYGMARQYLNNHVSHLITGSTAGLTNIIYWVVNGEPREKKKCNARGIRLNLGGYDWGDIHLQVTADIEPALIRDGEFVVGAELLVHHGERNG